MSSNNDHKYVNAFEALRRDLPEFASKTLCHQTG